jgi:putative ABC transport system permease protein
MVPIVPMRIASVKGKPIVIDTVPPDTTGAAQARGRSQRGGNRPPGGWAVRREYRSTYRDTTTSSETIVAGSWWQPGSRPAPGTPTLISVDEDIARDIGVGLGDEIVWDIQGVKVPTKVANLRRVDWGRFQTNFFVVFQSGSLDAAPQMLVTLTRVDSAAARGRLQRQVAERYPNVSAIDLAQVQQAIENVLGKAALAVRFLAFFSLAAGTIVLVGAVTTARFQRIREGVLLKTLGATRYQVLRVLLAEYAALGILSAATAIVLSSTAGWALAKWLFEVRFDLPFVSLTALTLGCIALTLTVGLWNSGEVLRRSPLAILREET